MSDIFRLATILAYARILEDLSTCPLRSFAKDTNTTASVSYGKSGWKIEGFLCYLKEILEFSFTQKVPEATELLSLTNLLILQN